MGSSAAGPSTSKALETERVDDAMQTEDTDTASGELSKCKQEITRLQGEYLKYRDMVTAANRISLAATDSKMRVKSQLEAADKKYHGATSQPPV